MWPETGNLIAGAVFAAVYGFRLAYQAYLLRHRDKSGQPGEWSELLLVVIPKNLLVVLTIGMLLYGGIPWNAPFFLGWGIFLSGIALRLIALHQLGPMYSLNVDIRSKHTLVTSGAFGLVRHPLYLAYMVDTAGILLFLQKWYLLPVLVCVVVGWAIRIRNEEAALRRTFGSAYAEYAARVPAINIAASLRRKLRDWLTAMRPTGPVSVLEPRELPRHADLAPQSSSKEMSEFAKSELEVHLAEYRALSDFQRDANSSFLRIAMYHNTGIVVVATWLLQQFGSPDGISSALVAQGYLLPLLFALPVFNAVLIVACAYQVYSFYCVARHFQQLRSRLSCLVGEDVLAYQDKFAQLFGRRRRLSLGLGVIAAVIWFVIPISLAGAISIEGWAWVAAAPTAMVRCAYWTGTVASFIAVAYLGGVMVALVRARPRQGGKGKHST